MTETLSTIAHNASEAAYPHLWKGLSGVWVPSLGVTGGTVRDVSRRGNHGTLTNMEPATDWQQNGGGWCLDFDGSNDYVNVGNVNDLNGTSELTIAYWCRKPAAARLATCGSQVTTTNGFWLTWYSDGNIYVSVRNGAFAGNRASALSYQDSWFHLCGVYDGRLGSSGLKIYVNGEQRAGSSSGTLPTALSSTAATQMRIGSLLAQSLYSQAKLRDVSLHSRALPAHEVRQLYALGHGEWLARKRRRMYSIPAGPAFKSAWVTRATTIAGVLQ